MFRPLSWGVASPAAELDAAGCAAEGWGRRGGSGRPGREGRADCAPRVQSGLTAAAGAAAGPEPGAAGREAGGLGRGPSDRATGPEESGDSEER